MELLSCLLPDSTSLHPVSWHIDPDQATAALSLISQQPAPECPLCHVAARRLHSRYERTLADLSWAGWTVRLELGVRKLSTLRIVGRPSVLGRRSQGQHILYYNI